MDSNTTSDFYYGVYVPNEQTISEEIGSKKIFSNKADALQELKKYKKARFKAFQYYHDAFEFVRYGSDNPNNNFLFVPKTSTPKVEAATVGEKPSQFKGPKIQDLVRFRKAIENGDIQLVRTTIWENPRYLISSGDTPAILQEGARYNALHVAAKSKNAEICNLILTTIGSSIFLQLIYGEENHRSSERATEIMLDLYLNTPDKALNETPLHFAVKFGALEVVEVLTSYPQCNKDVMNKFGRQPADLICSRMPAELLCQEVVKKISVLLKNSFFVPVIRSEDNCVQAKIGEPFSPCSPPLLNENPIEPRLEIHAYAGPMERKEAENFRKEWKTPTKDTLIVNEHVETPRSRNSSSKNTRPIRLQDTEKGLERIGRNLAREYDVGWKEYWPFLDTFVDLTSRDGLEMLENYLSKQYSSNNLNFTFNSTNFSSDSLDWSHNKKINQSNLFDSLDVPNENKSITPISDLCKNFDACTVSENGYKYEVQKVNGLNQSNCFHENILDTLSKSGLSPFLCIEKSCQIFATRITNHIIFLTETHLNETAESFESEVKHLKTLIGSYMNDSRFNVINFNGVHWRISQIFAQKLRDLYDIEDEIKIKKNCLEKIINNYEKMVDVFSSDDEALNNYRQEKIIRRNSTSDNKQVICLIENILKSLESENDYENIEICTDSEKDCVEIWSKALVCSCVWKTSSKSGRKSIKKFFTKRNSRYVNSSLENLSRRLSFEDDLNSSNENIGDTSQQSSPNSKKNSPSCSYNKNSTDSDEEIFYDARSEIAPSEIEKDLDFNIFEESILEPEVFLEGNTPSKTDYAVYTALEEIEISPDIYPYIYKWRHGVTLYSDEERLSWNSPGQKKYLNKNKFFLLNNETKGNISIANEETWQRLLGPYSPIKSPKQRKRLEEE